MILVISEDIDISTNAVIDWLYYFDKCFIRINNSDLINICNFRIGDDKFDFELYDSLTKKKIVRADEVKSYWLRRAHLSLNFSVDTDFLNAAKIIQVALDYYLKEEKDHLETVIHRYFERTTPKCLDNIQTAKNKKLEYLLVAQRSGLKVPPTRVVLSKSELMNCFKDFGRALVSKGLNESVHIHTVNDGWIVSPTVLISQSQIEHLPDEFFPSLIQKQIEKKCDIRTFYINGTTYSTAIFTSKKNEKILDYRIADAIEGTRKVPFKLPKKYEDSLRIFMDTIGRNTGSFDFLYTENGDLYFLEVNPVGQFGFISESCNYFIERKIADTL